MLDAYREQLLLSSIKVAIETNGQGVLCHLVAPLGAFTRGPTESEALAKVAGEYASYLRWLGLSQAHQPDVSIIQRHNTTLDVQDADSNILLDSDAKAAVDQNTDGVLDLIGYSAECFDALVLHCTHPKWIDTDRPERTFYGKRPNTIEAIFSHVDSTQDYYMSRMGLSIPDGIFGFTRRRRACIDQLRSALREAHLRRPVEVDAEMWTSQKVCRRFMWHDRIHAKSVVRILRKQREAGIIDNYDDPYRFFE